MLCGAVSSDLSLQGCCVDTDMERDVCVRQEVPLTASATEALEGPVAHVLQCARLSRVCSFLSYEKLLERMLVTAALLKSANFGGIAERVYSTGP